MSLPVLLEVTTDDELGATPSEYFYPVNGACDVPREEEEADWALWSYEWQASSWHPEVVWYLMPPFCDYAPPDEVAGVILPPPKQLPKQVPEQSVLRRELKARLEDLVAKREDGPALRSLVVLREEYEQRKASHACQ